MNKTYVRDVYGFIIGYTEQDSNGDTVAHNKYGKILGFYRKNRNVTTNFYGQIIGYGDLTSGLIWQEHNSEKK